MTQETPQIDPVVAASPGAVGRRRRGDRRWRADRLGMLRNVAPPPGAPLAIHLPRPWSVTAASAVAAIG
jgi:hypothetical protein